MLHRQARDTSSIAYSALYVLSPDSLHAFLRRKSNTPRVTTAAPIPMRDKAVLFTDGLLALLTLQLRDLATHVTPSSRFKHV